MVLPLCSPTTITSIPDQHVPFDAQTAAHTLEDSQGDAQSSTGLISRQVEATVGYRVLLTLVTNSFNWTPHPPGIRSIHSSQQLRFERTVVLRRHGSGMQREHPARKVAVL